MHSFPFFFVVRIKEKNHFALFWFRKIERSIRLPGEYELIQNLTAEEIGQILGGN